MNYIGIHITYNRFVVLSEAKVLGNVNIGT